MPFGDEELKSIKRRYRDRIMAMPGVCTFGLEKDDQKQDVFTIRVQPGCEETEKLLPASLEGVPVRIEHSDRIVPRGSQPR